MVSNSSLVGLIGIDKLKELQEYFFQATGFPNSFVDNNGSYVSHAGKAAAVCMNVIRQNELGCQRCIANDLRLTKEASAENALKVYKCHAGIWDASAPVLGHGILYGYIFIGQVLTAKPDKQKAILYAAELGIDPELYWNNYSALPIVSYDKLQQAAKLLFFMANAIAEEATSKALAMKETEALKKAKQKISEKETRFRELFNNMRTPVILCDFDENEEQFTVKDVNEAGLNYFKVEKQEVLNQQFTRVFSKAESLGIVNILNDVWHAGKAMSFPSVVYAEGKISYYLENFVYKLPSNEIVLIFEDLTDKKIIEEELRVHQNDLEKLVDSRTKELSIEKHRAEIANKAKSQFLSSMSHELRTPLNAIMGFGQLLQEDKSLSLSNQNNAKTIVDAGKHLLDLINELLDLSKIESGKLELLIKPIKTKDLISECIDLVTPMAHNRSIKIINFTQGNNHISGDKVRVKQIIFNLLSNAIKYNKQGGTVELDVMDLNKDYYRILVRDSGVGLKREYIDNLFEAFNRLGAENSDVEGTGIGLVISKELAILMGGDIGVKSEWGVGSTFWIDMPKGTPEVNEICGKAASQKAEADKNNQLKQFNILYIEDNPVNLTLVSQILSSRENINLYTAQTAEIGIEIALEKRPHIILLDIQLPTINGYEVLRILNQRKETEDIPVIAITANAMPIDVKQGKRAGFAEYLTKPLDIKQFNEIIENYLEEDSRACT